jgi:transposase InsO family protein
VAGWHENDASRSPFAIWAHRQALQQMRTRDLVEELEPRHRLPSLVYYSDHGSQYASGVYRALLGAHEINRSISRRGNPHDNARPIDS